MPKKKIKKNTCWNCGLENHGEKCKKCGATQDAPPVLGESSLGKPVILPSGFKSQTPSAVKVNEFKMPSPAKQPGRKPIKGQPLLF